MNKLYKSNLYVVLLHYPVLDNRGEIITSAITNLDLHDIARTSKTYGIKAFYVVTPFEDQAALVRKILDHWTSGAGAVYNPKRREALELIRVKHNFNEVIDEVGVSELYDPKIIATTARAGFNFEKYVNISKKIFNFSRAHILVFGTAWGLSDKFLHNSDYVLGPIKGFGDYNHLSVRSAVAIVLDRLFRN